MTAWLQNRHGSSGYTDTGDIAVIIATSWFRKAVITTHNPTI